MTEEKKKQKAEKNRINGKKGGRPKGSVSDETKFKQMKLEAYKQRVAEQSERLLDSQLHLAQGVSYLYKITTFKNGTKSKPELVEGEYEIRSYLEGNYNKTGDKEFYFITVERPDNKAIEAMMDRTYGRPETSNTHKIEDEKGFLAAIARAAYDLPESALYENMAVNKGEREKSEAV